MKNPDSAHPDRITVPVLTTELPTGTLAQQAFRQAILDVENLRERLRDLRAEQAEARRRYWQQVGPAATAVVAARHALYAPLEEALLLSYFSRLEEAQITGVILGNAHNLEDRFGEDEAAIIRKYAPAGHRPAAAKPAAERKKPADSAPEFVPDPTLPPHEQAAAAARARRKTKAQRQQEANAQADQKQLETNAKTIYRQLARTHHPDLERDPEKQADKTAQMQRITEAYEADDLYTLLQLLAESAPADAAADDVLARYTRALLQQQIQLKQEMNELKYGPNGFAMASGKKQELELRQLKRDLRAEAEYVQHIDRMMSDADGLRDVLRQLAAEGLDSI
ncbi:J domain-containing protein [Hymenobacter artigasi]|uniref:Pyruvate/2-oxoglutarate dehydrogenase complex dihydrolipoamide acyltransferase (E2) component n=1 Tax=Hymenobacter artigasi TaxID=2719616 RepID=A0ABX1HLE8_9BACT|nr:J domain-containing protein [Hymenobacter artigasi]NKI91084.1 pyruvate/2-oxoglutarate dehydrogenase complex dihydrolipoamide acyltransferase (E2) component [Hymenobacter artigasi]